MSELRSRGWRAAGVVGGLGLVGSVAAYGIFGPFDERQPLNNSNQSESSSVTVEQLSDQIERARSTVEQKITSNQPVKCKTRTFVRWSSGQLNDKQNWTTVNPVAEGGFLFRLEATSDGKAVTVAPLPPGSLVEANPDAAEHDCSVALDGSVVIAALDGSDLHATVGNTVPDSQLNNYLWEWASRYPG